MTKRLLHISIKNSELSLSIEVSANGEVFHKSRKLNQSDNGRGYKTIILGKKINGRSIQQRFYVHRLVALAFLGNPEGFQVNHIDFDRGNNNLSNLEIVTAKENRRHSAIHGRSRLKLSYEDFLLILKLHFVDKMSVKKILSLGKWERDTIRESLSGDKVFHSERYLIEGDPFKIGTFGVKYRERNYASCE